MAIHSSVCGNHYYTVRKECKTCTFYHVSVNFYLAREANDDDRRKKKSKSEGRQRQTRKEDDRYGYTIAQKLKIVLVAYRTCHRRRQIDGIKRKKTEDSKRQRQRPQTTSTWQLVDKQTTIWRMVNFSFESCNWFAWTFRELRVHTSHSWPCCDMQWYHAFFYDFTRRVYKYLEDAISQHGC